MGRDGLQRGRGGDGDGEAGLGAGAGPVELGQVVGELVHVRAQGAEVGRAGGAVVGEGQGGSLRGGLGRDSQEKVNGLCGVRSVGGGGTQRVGGK